ncbi:3-hydroxyacyl-CoA dehydrogenase family protein [Lysinibacillus sphaericus]|uniref:3-hydroxybutyryl-CoA dehydrogenase n=3 Tax=Lysinibacillus TaxID=400634 RepID=A0A2S0K3L0_LYSSH|nr:MULTISPECIES: 3-hydroxyacyl-CoA dehydrogenase family protein [Lysinibacillus]AHN21055.1 3-hydroxybutyryl-CoA dehydrogenase [Lysinibacillus varians]AVK97854.1 3-hydroxybutyryl-CoA dehydrogenase [Lysinibacillus sphaericus]MED4543344.1 3-hydroxyacyl-CoA dehydrogenase family protein [Lysinibacillus sphaericus]TKI21086.1 3-hydroxyacyl-CoA dehydrogenase family protein [Lysinibacillus sphaericus]TKI48227.1 3-hydroxyacyl-CoA dehydrogenase family protein [Lysinibacillus tabacifolii]
MKIGVIGAGVMGKGVAQRFAQYGHNVVLYDISSNVLETAREEIKKNLKIAGMFNKTIDAEKIVANIDITSGYEDFADMDFIIENVDENIKTKEIVYRNLEKVCKQKCIYMVNTSCIPITLIGSYTDRAEKVIGVHFMNPVPMKNFAEVIQGWKTSEETVQHVRELLNKAGMEIEVIKDSAGFVSNRLSHLFMNEAAALVYEGVATAEQIDNIFKNAFGHKMGPLETADLIGVDTVLDSLKVLYTHYEDPKFRACPLLKQMVYAGSTGRKSGKGFYSY